MNILNPKTKCLSGQREGSADCRHCAIRQHSLFAGLDISKFELLLKPIRQYCFPTNKLVFAQHIPATNVYVVRKGLIKLEETLPDGTQRIVRLIPPGGVAGLETVLDHAQRYDYSAITLRATELCQIPYAVLRQIQVEESGFAEVLMQFWHKQLLAAEQVIVDFSTGTVRERIVKILLSLAALAEQENAQSMYLPSVRDLAALSGVTRESASRVVAELKRLNLLSKAGVNQVQYDMEGLTSLIHCEEKQ